MTAHDALMELDRQLDTSYFSDRVLSFDARLHVRSAIALFGLDALDALEREFRRIARSFSRGA